MFNLKSHKNTDDLELLRIELRAFNVINDAGGYRIKIGDESLILPNLKECFTALQSATKELTEHISNSWQELDKIAKRIIQRQGQNSGSLDNLLFLNAVQKSFQLTSVFPQLDYVQQTLYHLLDTDIQEMDDHLIRHFNTEYLEVQSLHRLIMDELYRQKLIKRMMTLTKQAQISGPWANLDLPMKERVWEWDEGEEEYFDSRQKSRREQVRYNPENGTKSGFYYVWQDLNIGPYKWEDKEDEQPYQSRHTMTIP